VSLFRKGRNAAAGVGAILAIASYAVISILRLFPSREQRRQLLGILRSVQRPAQAELQCLSRRLYDEDGYDEAVLYLERWDSQEDFQTHVRSDLYRSCNQTPVM
jgi:quinol monooxygenase YgiN